MLQLRLHFREFLLIPLAPHVCEAAGDADVELDSRFFRLRKTHD